MKAGDGPMTGHYGRAPGGEVMAMPQSYRRTLTMHALTQMGVLALISQEHMTIGLRLRWSYGRVGGASRLRCCQRSHVSCLRGPVTYF